jgi:hypothetical protein
MVNNVVLNPNIARRIGTTSHWAQACLLAPLVCFLPVLAATAVVLLIASPASLDLSSPIAIGGLAAFPVALAWCYRIARRRQISVGGAVTLAALVSLALLGWCELVALANAIAVECAGRYECPV